MYIQQMPKACIIICQSNEAGTAFYTTRTTTTANLGNCLSSAIPSQQKKYQIET